MPRERGVFCRQEKKRHPLHITGKSLQKKPSLFKLEGGEGQKEDGLPEKGEKSLGVKSPTINNKKFFIGEKEKCGSRGEGKRKIRTKQKVGNPNHSKKKD